MKQDAIVHWMRNGHVRTAALVVATRLGLFERLSRAPADRVALASALGITPAAARVLIQFLHAGGC